MCHYQRVKGEELWLYRLLCLMAAHESPAGGSQLCLSLSPLRSAPLAAGRLCPGQAGGTRDTGDREKAEATGIPPPVQQAYLAVAVSPLSSQMAMPPPPTVPPSQVIGAPSGC